MKDSLTDNQPTIEAVQAGILATKSNAERLSLALNLSKTVIQMSKNALAKAHPGCTEDELVVLFVKLHYGEDLARGVKDALEKYHENS